MMTSYAGDKSFKKADAQLVISISSEEPLSLSDYAETLGNIDSVFSTCSKSVTSRLKGVSNKKRPGILVARDFKAGSLEIFADPYFSGVVSGVAANTVFAIFVHVMQRINGKPENNTSSPLAFASIDAISEERLREAATSAVGATSKQRDSLKSKKKTFGLSISIKWGAEIYIVTE